MAVLYENRKTLTGTGKCCALLALLGLTAAVSRHALYSLFQLAYSDSEYSHILLVVPIVVAFVLLEPRSKGLREPSNKFVSAILVIAAVAAPLVVRFVPADIHLSVQVFAVVIATWASVWLVYGRDFFRAVLFPMLFLLLLIPWPVELVAKLTTLLQSGSTTAAFWLFKAFHVPVTRQGFLLSLPSMDIEVAKECSGIRSTVMLFLTALVLGQLYLRSGWRKALLALAVLPIGVVRNGLRIFVLSILGTYLDEDWLEGNLHHRGGALFFALGLASIVLLLWILRRNEQPPPIPSASAPTSNRGVGAESPSI